MIEKDTGGPAFPLAELDQATPNLYAQHMGMTLRDYFAAKAMQGDWAAGPESMISTHAKSRQDAARVYYEMADAMLRARQKCPSTP